MTRQQRADELLRASLPWLPEDALPLREFKDRIRAYLAEPSPEPEYVWRVTTPVEVRPVLLDHYPVKREWQAKITRIERAPIGPWEVV